IIRRPPRSTLSSSSAASDVYKRQGGRITGRWRNRSDANWFNRVRNECWRSDHGSASARIPLRSPGTTKAFSTSMGRTRDKHDSHQNKRERCSNRRRWTIPVSYTHLRAHETPEHLVCRLLLEKK